METLIIQIFALGFLAYVTFIFVPQKATSAFDN